MRTTRGGVEPYDLPDRPGFFGIVATRGAVESIQFRSRAADGWASSGAAFTMDDAVVVPAR